MREQSLANLRPSCPTVVIFCHEVPAAWVKGHMCIIPYLILQLSPCYRRAVPLLEICPENTALTIHMWVCRRLFIVICKCKILEATQMSVHRREADALHCTSQWSTMQPWKRMRVISVSGMGDFQDVLLSWGGSTRVYVVCYLLYNKEGGSKISTYLVFAKGKINQEPTKLVTYRSGWDWNWREEGMTPFVFSSLYSF